MGERLNVGGQAVIEGVMMRSPQAIAIAIRKLNGEIIIKEELLHPLSRKFPLLGWPILRGMVALVEALVIGVRALTYSANQALEERAREKADVSLNSIILILLVLFALGVGILLFIVLPLVITSGLKLKSLILFNLVDGLVRLAIFLIYLGSISFMKDIQRIFQYHGAEHKAVYTYEAGEELIVDNARRYSVLHPRCGTSFLLSVMVLSIFIFSLAGRPPSLFWRIGSRLLLLPLIGGFSYEMIRYTAKRQENLWWKALLRPGLWLQRMTAKEPTEEQLEVALRALKAVLSWER